MTDLTSQERDHLAFTAQNQDGTHDEWAARYTELCDRYGGEEAVNDELERLYDLGYIDCGVSVRTGWLTDAGSAALGSGRHQ